MVLAALALFITVFAVLGGVGVVPTAPSAAEGRASATDPKDSVASDADALDAEQGADLVGPSTPADVTDEATATDPLEGEEAVPARSGSGRRIVFSETEQRVWLVRDDGSVRRTYLVSGSVEDNLDPGTYSVYSRSRWAVGLDDSGVMEFFVRFAQGERAAIGFHTIPTKLGVALQSRAQLGTPQSHGCIRQAKADAISLWKFAPEGTTVVVV
jgi:hypothetical protein